MAEGDKKKSSMPRISGETVIYAIPGLALVAFFAWVLFQMGSQNAGGILLRMLVGILVVLAGGGLVFWIVGKAEGSSDDDNDDEGPRGRPGRRGPSRRESGGLLDEARFLQVGVRHVGGVLLVEGHAGVELLHDLLGQRPLDVLDDLLARGAELLVRRVPHHENDVVGREQLLVVRVRHVLLGGELAIGAEAEREVRLLLVEVPVLALAGHELRRPLVDVLEAEQAVRALLALGEAGDRRLRAGLLGHLGDRLRVAVLLGRHLRRGDDEGVLERRPRHRRDLVLLQVLLQEVVRLDLVPRDGVRLDPVERRQRRAGVLRVAVDLARLEGLEGNLLRAEVQLLLDLEARRLQRLGVDLTEDVLLVEVLRPDGERLRGVGRVLFDGMPARRGRRRRRTAAARALVAAAAGGKRDGEAQHREEREEDARGTTHVVSVRLRSGKEKRLRRLPPVCWPTLRPVGVETRWARPRLASVARVMSATTMAAPSWPASP